MESIDWVALTRWVLLAGFGLAVLFGAIAQATHFCTMGAISDAMNMGDWTRARHWVLAIGVSMLGFALLSLSGQIDPAAALYASTRWLWLSTALGGLMFGAGMVLASGCGNKTLVRVGSGNLKALVVFVVMGIAAFATLKGVTAVARVATVDAVFVTVAQGAHLGTLVSAVLGGSAADMQAWVGLILGLLLVAVVLRHADFWTFNNLLAGVGTGGLIVALWWVSGHWGHLAEHPETLEEVYLATNSGRMESLSFVAPMAYTLDWLMFFSDKTKVLSLGIVTALGVVVGSAICALVNGSFRWEGFGSVEDLANHLVGAVLMGIGGVTAMGCTIGQGLSGVSTLSLNSFTALAAIVLGAVLAMRYQIWRLEQQICPSARRLTGALAAWRACTAWLARSKFSKPMWSWSVSAAWAHGLSRPWRAVASAD